jgi:hypothetical protein
LCVGFFSSLSHEGYFYYFFFFFYDTKIKFRLFTTFGNFSFFSFLLFSRFFYDYFLPSFSSAAKVKLIINNLFRLFHHFHPRVRWRPRKPLLQLMCGGREGEALDTIIFYDTNYSTFIEHYTLARC